MPPTRARSAAKKSLTACSSDSPNKSVDDDHPHNEVLLYVWVVVTYVGAAVGAGDAEVLEELGDGFGGHRRAPVGVEGELVAFDAVPGERVGDEGLGDRRVLGFGDGPAHDVAAEDVDYHVAVEVH